MSEGAEKLVGENGSPAKDEATTEKHSDKSDHKSLSESSQRHKHKQKIDHSEDLTKALSESGTSSRRKHGHGNSESQPESLHSSSHIHKSVSDNVRSHSRHHLKGSSNEHSESPTKSDHHHSSLSESSSSRRKHHVDKESKDTSTDHSTSSHVHKSVSESMRHSRHHLKSSNEHDRHEHKERDKHSHKSSTSNDHSTDSERHHLKSSDHSDSKHHGDHKKGTSDHHSTNSEKEEGGHRSHRLHTEDGHALKINMYSSSHSSHHKLHASKSRDHMEVSGEKDKDPMHIHVGHSSSRLNKSNDAIASGSVPVSKSPSPTSVHNIQNPFPENSHSNSPRENHRSHSSPLKKDDPMSHSKDKLAHSSKRGERKDADNNGENSRETLSKSNDKIHSSHILTHHHHHQQQPHHSLVTSGGTSSTNAITILLPPTKQDHVPKKVSREALSNNNNSHNNNSNISSVDLTSVESGQHVPSSSLSHASHMIDQNLGPLSMPIPTKNPNLNTSSLLKKDDPLSASQDKINQQQPGSPKKENNNNNNPTVINNIQIVNHYHNASSNDHISTQSNNNSNNNSSSNITNNNVIKNDNNNNSHPVLSTSSVLSLSTLETEKPSNTPEEAIMIATNVHNKFVKKKIGLNDFERLKLIGIGGVGHVYLVRLRGTQQLYAMKTCRKVDMEKQNKIKRALTEREVLATADHPFISTLYYSFQSSTQLCFIMQYCAGGEFYRVIQRQPMKCLLEDQVKFYASEVLLALEYLHLKGFIYRDLKPENILMHATGHVLLTDFDLSKHAANPVQPRIVTKMFSGNTGVVSEPDLITNSFVGTEEYLAPEVIKGTGHNATVDWWTFGILIYEMLFGVTPFKGKTQQETFLKIQKQPLVNFPPHPRGVQVTKTVKTLLKALLTVDNKKRLGTTGGATDIKDHPFFKDIKWQLLRQITPPIVPKLTDPLDTRYFKEQQDTWEWDENEIDPTQLASNDKWKDFLDVDHGERDADGDFGIPQKNNFNQTPLK